MTTVTTLLKRVAEILSEQQPEDSLRNWDFRSEVPNDEVDENKTLIAVLHLSAQDEVVKFNHTLHLDCSLTGQILIGEMKQSDLLDEAYKIYATLQPYLDSISMLPVEDAIILQAVGHGIETSSDGYYYSFSIPIDLYVQF